MPIDTRPSPTRQRSRTIFAVSALASLALAGACARTPAAASDLSAPLAQLQSATPAGTSGKAAVAARRPAARLPLVVVHKSPTCGCCAKWADHLRQSGFTVEVRDHDSLEPMKARLGIPFGKGSCHTAEVAGYFVEGHVPAADIKRLLARKPDAKGLVLPGMPAGSPGMELPDGTAQPYTVELVGRDGTVTPYAQH